MYIVRNTMISYTLNRHKPYIARYALYDTFFLESVIFFEEKIWISMTRYLRKHSSFASSAFHTNKM